MILYVMSDLHLEHHRDGGYSFIDSIPENPEAVLVLAGDVFPLRGQKCREKLAAIASKVYATVFVPGNHEFYGSEVESGLGLLKQEIVLNIPTLHLLEPGHVVELKGQRFLGGTGWYPRTPESEQWQRQRMISDFSCIRGLLPHAYDHHEALRQFLLDEVQKNDIVVTHHAPSPRSIAPEFRDSLLNCYFIGDMEDVIDTRSPKLWIHGHTHSPFDYQLYETRVYANPFGYPGEGTNLRFDDRMVIEVR